MGTVSKKEILEFIKNEVQEELSDEEMLQLILEKRVAKKQTGKEKYSFGQKAADRMAKFAGSWKFVIGFAVFLTVWITINKVIGLNAIDPFPFILLNLMLSCLAAIQAPLIMMSQNRQEEKDRERAGNDYKVNLKTEIIIEDLYDKLEEILANQRSIRRALKKIAEHDDQLEEETKG